MLLSSLQSPADLRQPPASTDSPASARSSSWQSNQFYAAVAFFMAFLTHKPHDSPIHSFSCSFIDDERTADRKRVTAQGLGLGWRWRREAAAKGGDQSSDYQQLKARPQNVAFGLGY